MRRLPKKLRIILIAIVVCCGCERLGIRFGAQPLPPPVRVDQGISNLGEAEPPSPAATEEPTVDETSRTDITEIIRPYTQWTLAETAADALGRMRHEAVPALVNYAFGHMDLLRVNAACVPSNARSIHLLEKCGFEQTGFAKAHLEINGVLEDHILMTCRRSTDR